MRYAALMILVGLMGCSLGTDFGRSYSDSFSPTDLDPFSVWLDGLDQADRAKGEECIEACELAGQCFVECEEPDDDSIRLCAEACLERDAVTTDLTVLATCDPTQVIGVRDFFCENALLECTVACLFLEQECSPEFDSFCGDAALGWRQSRREVTRDCTMACQDGLLGACLVQSGAGDDTLDFQVCFDTLSCVATSAEVDVDPDQLETLVCEGEGGVMPPGEPMGGMGGMEPGDGMAPGREP